MLESILADILNRYLKPYVKKLDTSQLRLGIWKGKTLHAPKHEPCARPCILSPAGDVCLENLELKEDIFVCIVMYGIMHARDTGSICSIMVIWILIRFTVD